MGAKGNVRDRELTNLIEYARVLGAQVRFRSYKKGGDDADWTVDGKKITIYVRKKDSKTTRILSLIHELGHHLAWVRAGRKIDPKIEEALEPCENKKIYRKRVLDMEINDAQLWEEIYTYTSCSFPIYKLYMQREFDIWQYQVSYETGRFPMRLENRKRWKELKMIFKKKLSLSLSSSG